MPREKSLANLNSVPDRDATPNPQGDSKEELDMFTNTTFYDFDIGRNTDVATTVDELLMQQEKQLQFPQQKTQQEEEAGTSGHGYSDASLTYTQLNRQPAIHDYRHYDQVSHSQGNNMFDPQLNGFQFDISSLQEFSLAGELPIISQHFYPADQSHVQHPNNHHMQPQDPNEQHLLPHQASVPEPIHQSHPQNQNQNLDDLHQVKPRNQRLHESVNFPPVPSVPSVPSRDAYIDSRLQAQTATAVNRMPISEPIHASPVDHVGFSYQQPAETSRHPNNANSLDRHSSSASEDKDSNDPEQRIAVEEDKRRRNTAASARFRIKKKLREQELERTNRGLQSKVDELEQKIKQLEMENKWLRNLVVDRNDQRDTVDLEEMRTRVLGKPPLDNAPL